MKAYKPEERTSEVWPLKWIIPLIVCGYLTGIGLVLLWYEWQPAYRNRDVTQLSLLYVCLGLLGITMLFSRAVRCVLVLALPSLGSSRGRALLITLAFFMATLGPIANILANLMALLRSLACGQELLRQAIGQMMDVVMEPVRAVQSAIELLLEEIRRVLRQVQDLLLRIQSCFLFIVDTFRTCAGWLKEVLELCNSELGTPWTRCQLAAESAMLKCRAKLGMFKSLCYATKIFLALCYPAKLVDVFCAGVWDAGWEILDTIMERYYQFVAHLEQMFDVSISFDHQFYFHTNASKNLSDVGEEILQDIRIRLRPFFIFESWLDLMCWLMLLAIFIKSIYFYLRYMHSLSYQNVFLTRPLYAIDRKYQDLGRPTVLPLHRMERFKYLKLSSLQLTPMEWLFLAESGIYMLNTCLQLGSICLADYSLFWLLDTIAFYGDEQDDLQMPAFVDVEVEGGGFVGDIIRGIAEAFSPFTQKSSLDPSSCLPQAVRPKYKYYVAILALCVLCWIILCAEPYILRVRHLIMQRFYPERAYVRALHLRQKIIQRRDGLLKTARRKARIAHLFRDGDCHAGCGNWLLLKLYWCCCCLWLTGRHRKEPCLLCAQPLSPSSRIQCATPGCKGLYCRDCFSDSRGECCLCEEPRADGDPGGISEVQDSSDDPEAESFGRTGRSHCGSFRRGPAQKSP